MCVNSAMRSHLAHQFVAEALTYAVCVPPNEAEPAVGSAPAPLAQLVEQRTFNPQVLGSSPRGRTHE